MYTQNKKQPTSSLVLLLLISLLAVNMRAPTVVDLVKATTTAKITTSVRT